MEPVWRWTPVRCEATLFAEGCKLGPGCEAFAKCEARRISERKPRVSMETRYAITSRGMPVENQRPWGRIPGETGAALQAAAWDCGAVDQTKAGAC